MWEIFGRASGVAPPKRDVVVRATLGAGRPVTPVRPWPDSAYAQRQFTVPWAEPGTVRRAESPPVTRG